MLVKGLVAVFMCACAMKLSYPCLVSHFCHGLRCHYMEDALIWSVCINRHWSDIINSHHAMRRSKHVDFHDAVIKWKHSPLYWSFVRGIHRSPVNSPHKGQWRGALMFFICVWTNGWVSNGESDDLRRHRVHYDVIVMSLWAAGDWLKIKMFCVQYSNSH